MNASESTLLTTAKYNLIIGLVLCWGFLINWLIVTLIDPTVVLTAINGWIVLIIYTASCAYGYYLFISSTKPLTSFIGYNLIVLPLGFSISLAIYDVAPELLFFALAIASFLTVLMMICGYLFPSLFQETIGVLALALVGAILIELFQTFILGISQEWIQWVLIALFCGYIGYDWGIANQAPKTFDNAIDSAAMLYIDIINLFLRIIKILIFFAQKKE